MRAEVWRQSDQAVRDGGYRLPDRRWVRLQVVAQPDTSERAAVSYRGARGNDTDDPATHDAQAPLSDVSVVQEDCLLRAMQLQREVGSVAVLNMANASSPGGGYRSGAGAQEENLHRRTDLWRFLHRTFYPLKQGTALVSKDVTVFRGLEREGYPFLEEPRFDSDTEESDGEEALGLEQYVSR